MAAVVEKPSAWLIVMINPLKPRRSLRALKKQSLPLQYLESVHWTRCTGRCACDHRCRRRDGHLISNIYRSTRINHYPGRRRAAKNELRERSPLYASNWSPLKNPIEKEIERSLHNIDAAIAPYTRFVRSEQGKLLEAQTSLEEIRNELTRLKMP